MPCIKEGNVIVCLPKDLYPRSSDCTICKQRTRQAWQEVFGDYSSNRFCGTCGGLNQDLNGWRKQSKEQETRTIELVKKVWKGEEV